MKFRVQEVSELNAFNNLKHVSPKVRNGRRTHLLGEPLQIHEIIKIEPAKSLLISQEYVELYEKGCSLHELARITGKSRHWIREILRRHKISSLPKLSESQIASWRTRPRTNAAAPIGFAYFRGQLVIEPREQEILLLIERLANEGMNPNAIAEHLNAKILKPRRAEKWKRNSVVLILRRNKESI